MFHYKDGWFFERNPDGSVRVLKMSDATGQAVKVSEANIDPDAWASIVSFVSAEGDRFSPEVWGAVKEFHMEGILRAPASPSQAGEPLTDRMLALEESAGLKEQVDRLANFILNEVPGEPSENEGAVDTAIRLIRTYLNIPPINPEPVPDEVFKAAEPSGPVAPPPNVIESPPPGAELEQPTEGEGKPPEGS